MTINDLQGLFDCTNGMGNGKDGGGPQKHLDITDKVLKKCVQQGLKPAFWRPKESFKTISGPILLLWRALGTSYKLIRIVPHLELRLSRRYLSRHGFLLFFS